VVLKDSHFLLSESEIPRTNNPLRLTVRFGKKQMVAVIT